MKTTKRLFLLCTLLISILLTLAGCNTGGNFTDNSQKSDSEKENTQNTQNPDKKNTIEKLEVWSAAPNKEHIYHVDYPYHFYCYSSDSGGKIRGSLEDLENCVPIKEMTEEEYTFFIDYITALPKQEEAEDSTIAYCIYIRYYDENGERQSGYYRGYEAFPKDWETFITRYNGICGGAYLTTGTEIQEVTPSLLTEIFGVTDDDVKDGTLQDVIDTQELDIVKITELFNMETAIDAYYASTKEDLLLPYRPVDLKSVESSAEEYDAFVKEYLDALGTDIWEETESDQKHLRHLDNKTDYSTWLYIGRTTDLEQLQLSPPARDDGYYMINLDAHMEGMIYSADFIYSADGKYFLVYDVNDPDILLPFVQNQN